MAYGPKDSSRTGKSEAPPLAVLGSPSLREARALIAALSAVAKEGLRNFVCGLSDGTAGELVDRYLELPPLSQRLIQDAIGLLEQQRLFREMYDSARDGEARAQAGSALQVSSSPAQTALDELLAPLSTAAKRELAAKLGELCSAIKSQQKS